MKKIVGITILLLALGFNCGVAPVFAETIAAAPPTYEQACLLRIVHARKPCTRGLQPNEQREKCTTGKSKFALVSRFEVKAE